jgi:hypothetical protein
VPFIAKNCWYTPQSHWVNAFILGCNGEFAVQFKRPIFAHRHHRQHRRRAATGGPRRQGWTPEGTVLGYYATVTCYFPQAPASYYDIAIGYGEPGQFVWQYLYRILPYVLIACPCPAQTCGPTMGCCAGTSMATTLYVTVPGGGSSVALIYQPVGHTWASVGSTYVLICITPLGGPSFWTLTVPAVGSIAATMTVCSPVAISFTTGGQTWTVTE